MGIASVLLAILAVLVAIFGVLFFGNVAGYIAIALAVIAGVLGFLKRRKENKGGIAGIVIGVLAIVIGFSMIGTTEAMMKQLKDEMIKSSGEKYKVARKYAEKAETNGGVYGFINSMLSKVEDADKEQLEKELSDLSALINDSRDGANSTEKKEEAPAPAANEPTGTETTETAPEAGTTGEGN